MKTTPAYRYRFYLPLALTVALGLFAWQAPGADDHGEHTEADLHEIMEHLGGHFKSLRTSVSDASKNTQTLQTVHEMQALFHAAKLLTPHTIEGKGAEAQLKYRKVSTQALRQLCDIEIALLEGDNDAAKAGVKELNALQRSGHQKYKPRK